jgi:hypothetical protein
MLICKGYSQILWITLWIDCSINRLIAVFITVSLICIKRKLYHEPIYNQ